MKAISASIIVLAAAVVLTGGSHVRHTQTQAFLQITGCIVGLAGLYGWYVSFRDRSAGE